MISRLLVLKKESVAPIVVLVIPFITLLGVNNPVISLILMLMICILPGLAMLEFFRFSFDSLTTRFFYAMLFSLLLLMVIFTSYSVITHALGVMAPLSTFPVKIICLILLVPVTGYLMGRLAETSQKTLKPFNWAIFLPRVIAMSLPAISLICVSRLNSLSDEKSNIAFLLILFLFFFLLTVNPSITPDTNLQAWFIYGISAALVLGTTFRGDGGFWGFDINREYFSALDVMSQGFWIPPQGSSAYDSMLSITVLPVVLSLFSNFSLTIIFKVFYALVLAYLPTVLYVVSTKYVSRFTGMIVSGALIIGSISYIPQMTALTRQVIAFVFFIGILLVIYERNWSRRRQRVMGLSMALGMAVSHYSTAYLASAIFIIALFVAGLIFLMSPMRFRISKPVFNPVFTVSLVLITVIWNGVITNSLEGVKPIIDRTLSQGVSFLPSQSDSLWARWLSGTVIPSSIDSAESIRNANLELNKEQGIKSSTESLSYQIKLADVPILKPFFGEKVAATFSNILIFGRTFFQIFGFLGLVLIIYKYFAPSNLVHKKNLMPRNGQILDLFSIGVASLIIGLIARTSGTLGPYYNPERTGLQIAIIILVPTAIAVEYILFRQKFIQIFLAVPLLFFMTVLLFHATSLSGFIKGSDVTRVSNLNVKYSPFIISESERSASRWLARNIPKNSYIQTDRRGFLVLSQNGRSTNSTSLDPVNLVKGSYIYATNSNVVGEVASAQSIIDFPKDYIDRYYQVIYSSNRARIYHSND